MSDRQDDNSFESEIVRIQRDIDSDLQKTAEKISNVKPIDSTELKEETEISTGEKPLEAVELEVKKEIHTVTESKPESPANEPQSSVITTEPPRIIRDTYYHETIKNESNKKDKSKFKKIAALVCAASVLGGSFLGIGISFGSAMAMKMINPTSVSSNAKEEPVEETAFTFNQKETPPADAKALEKDTSTSNGGGYSAIIKKVEPSVVNITSIVAASAESGFNYFNTPSQEPGQASGIIFHEDKDKVYVATNYHVVGGANEVKVSVSGKDAVPAKLVGRQPQSDLAVISMLKTDLKKVGIDKVTLAVFGDSSKMQVGEFVLAIGNAMGEGNTATEGIVSAINKEINVEDTVLNVIQTDAAINPGNSGGPLVNLKGEVIGINTAKLSASQIEGMGYSIASNIAKPIIEDLMSNKSKPFLGVRGEDLTKETAETYNLPQIGALIVEVVPGSSAEKGGIHRYDIIVGFNGNPIMTMGQLSEAIGKCKLDDEVEIKILRDGTKPMTMKIKLSQMNDSDF